MPTEHEKEQPHIPPASKPIEPVREVDPKDRDPNLLPPDQAGDTLPGEPPGVHRKGDAGQEEVKDPSKK
jgi:hypothetical protein